MNSSKNGRVGDQQDLKSFKHNCQGFLDQNVQAT